MSELDEAKARAKTAFDRRRPLLARWMWLAMPFVPDRNLVPDKETIRLIDEADQELKAADDALHDALREVFRLERNPERRNQWLEGISEE